MSTKTATQKASTAGVYVISSSALAAATVVLLNPTFNWSVQDATVMTAGFTSLYNLIAVIAKGIFSKYL